MNAGRTVGRQLLFQRGESNVKYCDLHTHSVFSDGTDTPARIVEEAVALGLSAVALCDHNNVDGLPDFLAAAEGKPIRAVAGAEFTVDYEGTELHLLGLFIPEEAFAILSEMLLETTELKRKNNEAVIRSLQNAGYEVDFDSIAKTTANGKFNRSNIAQALMEKGYVSSVDEAMNTLLSENGGHYTPGKRISALEMLKKLKELGVVSVLAHPLKNMTFEALLRFLPVAKENGLAGMECFYSEFSESETEAALALAHRFGLKPSGGSDYHGTKKPHIRLGFGLGTLRVPYQWALDLEKKDID